MWINDVKGNLPDNLVDQYRSSADSALLLSASRMRLARDNFFEAEKIVRSASGTSLNPKAIQLYMKAYQLAPSYMNEAGVLSILAPAFPQYGDAIFKRMLQITPSKHL